MKFKDLILKLKVKLFDINTIPKGLDIGDYVVLMNGNIARINIKKNDKSFMYGARDLTENLYLVFNRRGREIDETTDDYDILRLATNEDLVHLLDMDLKEFINDL